MLQTKIQYGIDLGTTNSAISFLDNDKLTIVKSDKYQKDTTPSCVHFNKKGNVFVGDDAKSKHEQEIKNRLSRYIKGESVDKSNNSFVEFKRSIGTDKNYYCANLEEELTPEQLSSEVLKKLKSFVKEGNVQSSVITVPAKFKQYQIDATQRAAEIAGFQYCELLQEPIAASLAYGIDNKSTSGFWLVFDFGGGTFDVALMHVEDGIIKVVDTEGDNHLGGKDIDLIIVDKILYPYIEKNYVINSKNNDTIFKSLLRERLKFVAEDIKIALSSSDKYDLYIDDIYDECEDDNGNEIILDLSITLEQFEDSIISIFKRAVDISNSLLSNNNVSGEELYTVILVGGPTLLSSFREYLKNNLSTKINTNIDPMIAVTKGAALFASTRSIPIELQERDTSKIQLKLMYPDTSVEPEEELGIKIERDGTTGDIPDEIFIELTRSDKGWSSGRIEIIDDAEIITLHLIEGKSNTFEISLSDENGNKVLAEPDNFTIIQGMKVASSTLPYYICIDAFDSVVGKQLVQEINGLSKNQSLPAKGKAKFRTQKDIRPGSKDDKIFVPVYECEKPNTRAIFNTIYGEFYITGEDIPEFLPTDSEIEITIEVDSSRRFKVSLFIPSMDETIDKYLPERKVKSKKYVTIKNELDKARSTLGIIENTLTQIDKIKIESLRSELLELSELLESNKDDSDMRLKVFDRLNNISIELDSIEAEHEWPVAEQELDLVFDKLQATIKHYGDDQTQQNIKQYEAHIAKVKQQKNPKLARDLKEQILDYQFSFLRKDIGFWISILKDMDDHFEIYEWGPNRDTAHKLITEGKHIVSTSPSVDRLQPIVSTLFGFLPDHKQLGEVIPDLEMLKK